MRRILLLAYLSCQPRRQVLGLLSSEGQHSAGVWQAAESTHSTRRVLPPFATDVIAIRCLHVAMKTPPDRVETLDDPQAFKRFLGPAGEGYADAQLRQLSREMYAMADLLLDVYERNSKSRKPTEGSPSDL